ncbi:MAG: AMP-binding protein, partial [Bacteroidota bacterium]
RNGHVKPNQVACLIMDRSVELIIGILAVLKSGGSYIVIEPDLPASRKAYILKDSETQFILTTSDYLFDIPDQQCELFAIDLQIDSLDESKENPKIINRGTDLAYLIYTSGSTGNPKGVMVEHCGVVNLSNWQSEKFDISSESNVLQMFSYSFDGAVGETFMALLNGATLHQVFLSSISAEKMIEYINDHDVSLGVFVPSFLKQMNKYQTSRPERLTVVSVGEECTLELAEAWRQKCNFVNAYGPTEYTVYSHYYDVSKDAIISKNRSIPIGTSINNTKTYILSSEDKIAPIGVDGQLCISGLGLARGYLNNSDYSFQKFLPNHFFLKEVCKDIGSLEELISPTELEEFRVQCQSKNTVTSANIIKNEYAPEDLLENLHILDEDLQLVVKNILEKYSSDTDSSVYQGYCRYFIEGINDSYQSHGINERIIKHLFPFDSFKNKNGIDFGFGNGEVLRILEELGANVTGLDWNPHFVQKARDLGRSVKVAKIDDTTETFFDQYGIQRESLDFAISTLVLDRLNKPYNLFLNIFESLKVGGYFAIQTLLPIIPEDDGDVTNKIVYTKKENRISPGENIDADKLYVAQILYALGADTINVAHMPYVVSSRDGIQQYTLWSFYGTKSAIGSKVERHKFSQMYKTGDMARYLDDGNIQFSGRKDDQIKLRGFRIEISEIEQVILSYDKIKDGIVTAARQGSEPYLIAYIICEEEGVEDELKNYLISVLPSYMVPSYIINVDCFPLTKSGKIDKNSLPDPTLIKDSSRNIQKPTNATQRHLANLWEQVLGKSGFGIEDNFFALGGHSLMAVKLVSLIGRELELKLDIKDIFDNPTIYLLSQFVDSNVVQKLKSINPVEEQQ